MMVFMKVRRYIYNRSYNIKKKRDEVRKTNDRN